MKACFLLLLSTLASCTAVAKESIYVGSTPAHAVVRDFLLIPATDSIDFIRWQLETGAGVFKLQCRYGISKPGTPGFINEQRVAFDGTFTRSGSYYFLKHNNRLLTILEMNANILHLLDRNKNMLAGNGGYSYALNNIQPLETDDFHFNAVQSGLQNPLVFEGRTPCQELSALLGLNKREVCKKLKWYFLLYTDSVTGKPAHFLMGGIGYRKESMAKGRWEIVRGEKSRIIYRLYFDKWVRPLDLLKGDDNVLFFTDAKGRLMVGNEDFSYTLNRKNEEYPPVVR